MLTVRQAHWEMVYANGADNSFSWFEETPETSIALINAADPVRGAAIDIGGGASRMGEMLLSMGLEDVACLDLSAAAQEAARARAGPQADSIRWIVADVTQWAPDRRYDLWHDRAAFHFLTEAADQERYAKAMLTALNSGGIAIVGTFAPDGPDRCSRLPVARHDGASLATIFGAGFELLSERRHAHRTPGGVIQKFQFSTFRRR